MNNQGVRKWRDGRVLISGNESLLIKFISEFSENEIELEARKFFTEYMTCGIAGIDSRVKKMQHRKNGARCQPVGAAQCRV